jgi:hypothetical protein
MRVRPILVPMSATMWVEAVAGEASRERPVTALGDGITADCFFLAELFSTGAIAAGIKTALGIIGPCPARILRVAARLKSYLKRGAKSLPGRGLRASNIPVDADCQRGV